MATPEPSLEMVWADREEVVYPNLFGSVSRGIFPLSADLFSVVFKQTNIDPRWLHHGVFEYSPTVTRPSWLYVTSGTSNPWDIEPESYATQGYSGIGTELVLESAVQADWPIVALQRLLAYNVLLSHGRFGDLQPLDYGDRVPLGGPIVGGPIDGDVSSLIQFVAVAKPLHYASTFELPSGIVDFLHIVGITESERDYAKMHGTDRLIELLSEAGAFPVTNPKRSAVV